MENGLNEKEEEGTIYAIVRSQDDHMELDTIGYTEKQAYESMLITIKLYVRQILGERYLPERGNYWDVGPTDGWIYTASGDTGYIRWKVLKIIC